MINDAQTHRLPRNAEGFDRLARFMGEGDTQRFRAELLERLKSVEHLMDPFFKPDEAPKPARDVPPEMAEVIDRWPSYPALRSERASELFERLKPGLLERLDRAARPQEALLQFDGFLRGLPAGVQLFALFDANPQLVDLLIDICATAPGLAQHLSRNSSVLDAVLGGGFFADWPGADTLTQELRARLEAQEDYEALLDDARRWTKEWHFRVGVHHLRGLIGATEAARQYADLAEAVLRALWPPIQAEFARRHGPPPGRGAMVLGMGSLGARRLHAASDLDLIVIYDAAGVESSEGKRPLAARSYYARLTQALVTALSAPMAEGKLYDVDMRLRPSGRQGPVATPLAGFRSYQQEEAWTWEHLALTRARPMTGEADLCAEVEAFRRELLSAPRDRAKVAADWADMRRRLAEAKPAKSPWDVKAGPGGMQDVELMAQAGALLSGSAEVRVRVQLAEAQNAGLLDEQDASRLKDCYRLLRKVNQIMRLLTLTEAALKDPGMGAQSFLLRETGAETIDALQQTVERAKEEAAAIIERAVEAIAGDGAQGADERQEESR
jgi:glutamate-ammonia-ligase adenylyltransferase